MVPQGENTGVERSHSWGEGGFNNVQHIFRHLIAVIIALKNILNYSF